MSVRLKRRRRRARSALGKLNRWEQVSGNKPLALGIELLGMTLALALIPAPPHKRTSPAMLHHRGAFCETTRRHTPLGSPVYTINQSTAAARGLRGRVAL